MVVDTPAVDDNGLRAGIMARFPQGSLEAVEVRRHGDDARIEPGTCEVRLVAATKGAGPRPLERFRQTHAAVIDALVADLPDLSPEPIAWLHVVDGTGSGRGLVLSRVGDEAGTSGTVPPPEKALTAVITRLDPTDLRTLDTLVAAGIASSRADAVRWALARIRERPVYKELEERVREIEQLKSRF